MMKIILIFFALSVAFNAAGQIRFYGCAKDDAGKPIGRAQITVRGVKYRNNILLTDANGIFLILFDKALADTDFQLEISKQGYASKTYWEKVISTVVPKVYHLPRILSSISAPIYRKSKPITRIKMQSAATVEEPDGDINKSWIEHNVTEGSNFGFKVHVNFDVDNIKGRTGLLAVDFFDLDGNPIPDKDNSLNYDNGNIGVEKKFKAAYLETTFEDLSLFIPYDELKSVNGKHHSMYRIRLFYRLSSAADWLWLAESRKFDLEYDD